MSQAKIIKWGTNKTLALDHYNFVKILSYVPILYVVFFFTKIQPEVS